ncbi:MAG: hypothetical protein R2879_02215 [Saprospiraceae bacterium]
MTQKHIGPFFGYRPPLAPEIEAKKNEYLDFTDAKDTKMQSTEEVYKVLA